MVRWVARAGRRGPGGTALKKQRVWGEQAHDAVAVNDGQRGPAAATHAAGTSRPEAAVAGPPVRGTVLSMHGLRGSRRPGRSAGASRLQAPGYPTRISPRHDVKYLPGSTGLRRPCIALVPAHPKQQAGPLHGTCAHHRAKKVLWAAPFTLGASAERKAMDVVTQSAANGCKAGWRICRWGSRKWVMLDGALYHVHTSFHHRETALLNGSCNAACTDCCLKRHASWHARAAFLQHFAVHHLGWFCRV